MTSTFFLEHAVSVISLILTLTFVSSILRSKRPAGNTMAWLLLILLVPYLGIPLYFMFGGRKILSRIQKKEIIYSGKLSQQVSQQVTEKMFGPEKILAASGVPGPRLNQSLELIENGNLAFLRYLSLIQNAKRSIFVTTFIFGNDPVGRELLGALAARAASGLDVRILVDSLAAVLLRHPSLLQFKKSGGKIAYFMPIFHIPFRGRTNLRNHRKLLVVDSQIALLGGMNLAQEYMGPTEDPRRWADVAVQVKGESVFDLQNIFFQDWNFACRNDEKQEPANFALEIPTLSTKSGLSAQVVASGPDVRGDPLYDVLLSSIHSAQKEIRIVTPYFIPDESLTKALELAAKRGVAVRVLMPRKSNHLLADIARGSFIRQLQSAGVGFDFYSQMIHAKIVLIDQSMGLLGSANFDMRSLLLNYEVGILVYDQKSLAKVHDWVEGCLAKTTHSFSPETFARQLLEGIGRVIGPFI